MRLKRPRQQLTLLGGLMTCADHGYVCFGGSATHTPIYVAHNPGHCHVSMSRNAADAVVEGIVLARLRRPDAIDLFTAARTQPNLHQEIDDLVTRRAELASLVAEGLLSVAAVRPKLTEIRDRLLDLEGQLTPPTIDSAIFVDPQTVWKSWAMPQRREVLRLLFEKVTIRHVGQRNGPRADPSRLGFEWRESQPDTLTTPVPDVASVRMLPVDLP